MERYIPSTMDNNEALDFTSAKKKTSREQDVESPVLDLSCKKQNSSFSKKQNSSSCSLSPVSFEGHSSAGSIGNSCVETSPDREESYGDPHEERKSPFEGRNFMVTPPSETDSPKKHKYEANIIYDNSLNNGSNMTTSNDQHLSGRYHYPLIAPSHAIPMMSAILPPLSVSPNGDRQPISVQQVPVSTTSAPSSASLIHEVSSPMTSPETAKKAPRPFKAYPKDPLSLSVGNTEVLYDQNSNEAYSEFRKRMLESVRRTNEGTNIKMRRVSKSPGLPTSTMDDKDAAYWERRRKNNEAAKRSRDARRAKEDEIAIRAAFLEQENMKLRYELVALRTETAKLRCMVYSN